MSIRSNSNYYIKNSSTINKRLEIYTFYENRFENFEHFVNGVNVTQTEDLNFKSIELTIVLDKI